MMSVAESERVELLGISAGQVLKHFQDLAVVNVSSFGLL